MTLRLLAIARRFWPHCDESCHRLNAWASTLQRHGIAVTILTGRWHSSWPGESDCREVKVVRLLPPPKSSWSETLFLRNVAAWIGKNRQRFDVIYVDESRALLHQVGTRAIRGDLPIVCRFSGVAASFATGIHSLAMITQSVDACRKAERIVVTNATAHRQLQSAGISSDRIVRIPDVAWNTIHRTNEHRKAAAQALKKVNQDMVIPVDTRLLLYVGEIDHRANLQNLLRAAIAEIDRHRRIRLWLIGSGQDLPSFHELVQQASCHHDILFHSPFDDHDGLLGCSSTTLKKSLSQCSRELSITFEATHSPRATSARCSHSE